MEHIGILTVIALVLAAIRLTRLVVADYMPFGPLRDKASSKGSKLGVLMNCPFCTSVWVGGFLAGGQALIGDEWGWQVFIGAMALSGVVSLLAAYAPQVFEE